MGLSQTPEPIGHQCDRRGGATVRLVDADSESFNPLFMG
jgi:hypothetical protein